MSQRPSIQQVTNVMSNYLNGSKHHVPKTINKGNVGNYIEKLCGIPTSSACLDCTDGEVKSFPLSITKKGIIVPKETIAITMMNPNDLSKETWDETRLAKKTKNILFIGYIRDDEYVTFHSMFTLNEETHPELFLEMKNDYNDIQNIWNSESKISSTSGKYIQSRTKGAGHGSTTRAWYFKKLLINYLMSKKE